MHLSWNTIKQRPQFVAENLTKYYTVTVMHNISFWSFAFFKKKGNNKINYYNLTLLPLTRYKLFNNLNVLINKVRNYFIIKNYQIIWLTFPEMLKYLPYKSLKNKKIIYDCMDDILEFNHILINKIRYQKLKLMEHKTVDISDIIFCSSNYLMVKMKGRYGNENKYYVVNNGYSKSIQKISFRINDKTISKVNEYLDSNDFIITYTGTIDEWFDIDILIKTLKIFNNITYILVGPVKTSIPSHHKIKLLGVVEHRYIKYVLSKSNLLVMPFKLNELILSVNPVKLYEYIESGNPIIATKYGETLKFKEFVYLYNTFEEYSNYLSMIMSGKNLYKQNKVDRRLFCQLNDWSQRVNYMYKIMQTI